MRALVAFGTRYGSTAKVAAEIASVLQGRGMEATVVDLRNGSDGVDGYDLVVVGSSIIVGSWSKEAQGFLERNRTALSKKRVALFACCGDVMLRPGQTEELRTRYLTDVAARYGIEAPCALGLFGGELDFSKYGFLLNAFFHGTKKDLERKGIDISRPYDFRDWDAIRAWAGVLISES